jgi:NAD(P)-dependent dehydrogenase (short-subunit alcohol dehydrogenase family)
VVAGTTPHHRVGTRRPRDDAVAICAVLAFDVGIGEFGPSGVRVNAISPGVIRAPNPDGSDPGRHPNSEVRMLGTPAGTSWTPDAVAHAAVYLASDEAAFVHGSVFDVDGGRTTVAVIAS